MSTAIETKYVGATNYEPSRIKAFTRANWGANLRAPSAYYSLGMVNEDSHQSHINAAKALAEKLGWFGVWAVGDTHTGIVAVRLGGYRISFENDQLDGFVVHDPANAEAYEAATKLFPEGISKVKVPHSLEGPAETFIDWRDVAYAGPKLAVDAGLVVPTSSDSEND